MGRRRMVSLGAVSGDFTADSPTLHVDSTNDRVGVNTLTPAVPLDVIGIAAVTTADGDNTQGVLRVGRDSGGAAGGELVWHTDDHIGLRCADSGALPFVVVPSGNVGIGVTDPDELLEVAGRVHLGQIAAPGTTTDKLYNVGGTLTWAGTALGGAGVSADDHNILGMALLWS